MYDSTLTDLFYRVVADPADDVLRLAVADHVQEINWGGDGERAAEWIRLQVEYGIGTPTRNVLDYPVLTNEVRERLSYLAARVCAPVVVLHNRPWPCTRIWHQHCSDSQQDAFGWRVPETEYVIEVARWDRGWPAQVQCRAEDWVRWGDLLCEKTTVYELTLTTRPRYLVDPAQWHHLIGDSSGMAWYGGNKDFHNEAVIRKRWTKLKNVSIQPGEPYRSLSRAPLLTTPRPAPDSILARLGTSMDFCGTGVGSCTIP